MLRSLIILIALCISNISFSQSYLERAWEAMEKKDYETARSVLEKVISKDKDHQLEAAAALTMLNTLHAKEKESFPMLSEALKNADNPSPYFFALWENQGLQDGFVQRDNKRLDFFTEVGNSPKFHTSVKGALKYFQGMSYLYRYDTEKSNAYWESISSLKEWQFTGPFNNANGGGFDKAYAPQTNPQPDAVFKSLTDADVNWFSPAHLETQPYIATIDLFSEREAIIYAQTFVDNPTEREVVLAAGFTGPIKVWVNDKLVVSEEEDLRTDLDYKTSSLTLPAGTSRVLVQLGFTSKTNYPNFIVRFLDPEMNLISDLASSSIYKEYNAPTSIGTVTEIPHFANQYFEEKAKAEPDNLLNNILLSNVYNRSFRFNDALRVLEKAEKKYPNNIILRFKLMNAYSNINDRTRLVESIEDYRKAHPESYFFAIYDFQEEMGNENYNLALEHLNKIKKIGGADDPEYYQRYIQYLGKQNDMGKMMEVANEAYDKYPHVKTFAEYKFEIEKNINPDKDAAIAILEKYLEEDNNNSVKNKLINELIKRGDKERAGELIFKRIEEFPHDLNIISKAVNFTYTAGQYKEALKYTDMALANMPYHPRLWQDRGYIQKELGNKKEAITAFEKAISFAPNKFNARDMVRELKGQKSFNDILKREDSYDVISKALNSDAPTDENYEYIFNENNRIIFEEGASISHFRVAIKINNQAGIEDWKETSIGTSDDQSLDIITAEAVKKGGKKIKAEQNKGTMVFPNLEIGDAIFVEYKLENYTGGALRKEFWAEWVFNEFYPVGESVFRLIAPKGYKFSTHYNNVSIKPEVKKMDDLEIYTWQMKDVEKLAYESFMPTSMEVGKSLFISTIDDWRVIADWYQELSLTQAKESYNLDNVYDEIFGGKNITSDYEKARMIYEYLSKNVSYSSLPFRQNNYTPQKPMVTISTQLGDCKDLSVLYHTLARKAGLNTNLVLVNTRNNGENNMPLPTINFDHCIIKIDLEGESFFQELTNSKLPFGYLPQVVQNAQALVIPNKGVSGQKEELITIPARKNAKELIKRTADIKIEEDKIVCSTTVNVNGDGASDYRYYFTGLTQEELDEKVQETTSSYFDKSTKVKDFNLEDIDNIKEQISFTTNFEVEDPVIAIGGMKAINMFFFEEISDMETFTEEDREHPFLLWQYNSTDAYETELSYSLPEGMTWIDLPKDFSYDTPYFKYSLEVKRDSDTQVTVSRKVYNESESISTEDYAKFREMMREVLKQEDAYLVYK